MSKIGYASLDDLIDGKVPDAEIQEDNIPDPNIDAEESEDVDDEKDKIVSPNTDPVIIDKEVDEDSVKAFFKNKYGKEIDSFDNLFKEPEKIIEEKIVNPYEDIQDDYLNKLLEFRKDTGLGRAEFDFVQQDVSTLNPLDLARQQVKEETGKKNLSNEDIDAYLEDSLGIDLSEKELSPTNSITLNKYVKPQIDKILSQQEKYKATERQAQPNQQQEDIVTLSDGQKMPREKYNQLVREEYTKNVTEAVNSVTANEFSVTIDDNGEEKTLNYSYEFSKEDKHGMLSNVLDLDAFVNQKFKTEKGFDHKGLSETLWRGDKQNFDKVLAAVAKQVRAEAIEEMIANGNNENFTSKNLHDDKPAKKEGYVDPYA
ncbi:hypothetical protein [Wenyingzhuangia sp. 2_MG-2023]|uniref:hypothetical protein n=1 Tax=Wenyingzhuangia sp. 2_MG-2023 TaxID=3062639 RepID=UPI0026E20DDF|nr:hypothetical protein [Wenyingzhuangia sp. 2_MG-2023]MDO6737095.1 hypothetical protein [Wenyingzhuangia sp. 2_MG-2023]